MADPVGGPGLQFDQAEIKGAGTGGMACALCRMVIPDEYHQVSDRIVCGTCRQKVESSLAKRPGVLGFLKALSAGIGAAMAGAVVWYLIATFANMQLGIIAIAVGFAVGFAVRWGARGYGGWLYQLMAVVLSYLAIVTSYMPAIAEGLLENVQKRELAANQSTPESGAPLSPAAKSGPKDLSQISLFGWMVIFGLAFEAPFLMGASFFMGWIIIGIALYEAWKINKRTVPVINGPYAVSAGAPPLTPGG